MKTILRLSASAALLACLIAPAHAADGWTFLPISKPGFKMEPVLALTVNSTEPANGSSATGWGIDANFNCGLIQSPGNRMRTHLNISHSSKGGDSTNAFELSPRYTVPLSGVASFGVGPSLAVFNVTQGNTDKTLYGIGLAAGLNYRIGQIYAGFDVRYHSTSAKDGIDYDPTTIGVKVGFAF